MGVRAQWYVENRVAMVILTGKPTADELRAADGDLIRMMQSVPDQTVHLMLDASDAQAMPPFAALRNLGSRKQPNKGWVIIFGDISPLIRAVAEIAARALRDNMRMFRYRSDALRYLKSVEPELALPTENSPK
jgi:hypothetical protein